MCSEYALALLATVQIEIILISISGEALSSKLIRGLGGGHMTLGHSWRSV